VVYIIYINTQREIVQQLWRHYLSNVRYNFIILYNIINEFMKGSGGGREGEWNVFLFSGRTHKNYEKYSQMDEISLIRYIYTRRWLRRIQVNTKGGWNWFVGPEEYHMKKGAFFTVNDSCVREHNNISVCPDSLNSHGDCILYCVWNIAMDFGERNKTRLFDRTKNQLNQ